MCHASKFLEVIGLLLLFPKAFHIHSMAALKPDEAGGFGSC
jgi:hypothetical protein